MSQPADAGPGGPPAVGAFPGALFGESSVEHVSFGEPSAPRPSFAGPRPQPWTTGADHDELPPATRVARRARERHAGQRHADQRHADQRHADRKGHGRAGRNLPAAVAVGAALAIVVVLALFIRKEAFVAVLAIAIGISLWELIQALGERGIAVPVVPVLIGAVAMIVAGYSAGGQALAVCFMLTAVGVALWRTSEGVDGALGDVAGGIFASAYLPLLAGFVSLMLATDDGAWRVFTYIAVTIASDTGGYIAGVLAGRHPMAPSVSPRKSWEGFSGSVLTCVVVGVVCVTLGLNGPWWLGVLLGAATASTATLGDLAESMIKRDLGIKDMGSVLPGHGGFLDRLDSLVLTAPMAWLLLHLWVG
ncbi:MAG: phosphatidate cytidylyltransferase [Angustibacter sp.]